MEEDRLIREIRKVFSTHHELLQHVGADNVGNAKKKIDRERAEFARTKEQLQEVVNALDADNWRNAVVRAKSLLNKLEREALPLWLRSISPFWVGRIAPSSYKHWHTFCREQFLVALSQLQSDVELGIETDVEREIESMKRFYLTRLPGEFVDAVSAYVTEEFDEYEFEEELKEEKFEEWQEKNAAAREKRRKSEN